MLALVLLGCSGAEVSAPIDAPADGFERMDRRWYTIDLPAGWPVRPLATEKRRAMFDVEWTSPPGDPDLRILVGRPRPVKAPDGPVSPAIAGALGFATGGAAGSGQLLGGPATWIDAAGTTPDGQPLTFGTWIAARDGYLFLVQCSGSGAGAARSTELCPTIVGSFRLSRPLPVAPSPLPAEAIPWAHRTLGPLAMDVPEDWIGQTQEWLDPKLLGGFRSPIAPDGPFELSAVSAMMIRGASTPEALADQVVASGAFRRVGAEAIETPIGPGLRTELTDGLVHRSLLDVVVGGIAVEVACDLPERGSSVTEGWCTRVFGSLEITEANGR